MSRGPQNTTARYEALHRYLLGRGAVDDTRIHVSDFHRVVMVAMEVATAKSVRDHIAGMVSLGYVHRVKDHVVFHDPPRPTATGPESKAGRPRLRKTPPDKVTLIAPTTPPDR